MTRRRRGMPLSVALAILAALFLLGVVIDATEHLALLAIALGPSAVAFWAGRRWERRRSVRPSRPRVSASRTEPPAVVLRRTSRDDLLDDPRSGARPFGGDR